MSDGTPFPKLLSLIDDELFAWRDASSLADGPALTVLSIDLRGATDREAVFARTSAALDPEDPPPIRTWSGLEDRLWEAIVTRPAAAGAIVWRHVDDLSANSLADLFDIVAICTDVARTAADPQASGRPEGIALSIVLTGTGASFETGPF